MFVNAMIVGALDSWNGILWRLIESPHQSQILRANRRFSARTCDLPFITVCYSLFNGAVVVDPRKSVVSSHVQTKKTPRQEGDERKEGRPTAAGRKSGPSLTLPFVYF